MVIIVAHIPFIVNENITKYAMEIDIAENFFHFYDQALPTISTVVKTSWQR